jgi:hypothetical protein
MYEPGKKITDIYKYTIFDSIITNCIKITGLIYDYKNTIKIIENTKEDRELLKNFNIRYIITNNNEK